jgi:hypothetical protein
MVFKGAMYLIEMLSFLPTFERFFFCLLRTKLLFSTTYHPYIDGQIEVVNITLTQLLNVILQNNLKN